MARRCCAASSASSGVRSTARSSSCARRGRRCRQLPDGVEVVEDAREGRGPLQGLAAGLAAVARPRADAAYASSTDVPLLHPRFIHRVLAALDDDVDVVLPEVGGFRHPLAAVYRTELVDVVERLIAEDRMRPAFLFEACRVRRLDADALLADPALAALDPDLDSLLNLNEPADYEAARARPAPEVTVRRLRRAAPPQHGRRGDPALVAAATLGRGRRRRRADPRRARRRRPQRRPDHARPAGAARGRRQRVASCPRTPAAERRLVPLQLWRRPPSPAAISAAPSSSTSPTRAPRRCPCPTTCCARYIGGAGLGRLADARARARRASTRSAPEAPLAFCFSPLVGTPLTTSAKFAVVAKSPLTGLLNDALASSHFAIAGQADRPRRDRRARRVRRAVGPGHRRRRPAARAGRRPVGPAGRRGRAAPARAARQGLARRRRSARPASGWSATPRSPTTAATRAAAASAPCSARSCSRRSPCAPRPRSRPPTRRRSSPPHATCARARSARRPRSTASSARSRTCSPSTRSRRCRRATSRPPPSPTRRGSPPRTSPRRAAVARDSCASCSIGCEHIYKGAERQAGARRVRERLRARPAVRRLRPRRRARGQRPLRRARARHHLGRRHDRLGDGVRRARPDRRAVAALRRRRRAAARDRGDRRPRGARRAAGRGLARGGRRSSARARPPSPRTSRGSSCPATSRARCRRWRSGLRSTRAAPTTTARAPTRPTSPARTTASSGGSPHVAAAIETEDRAAVMDSLILCKFLRGVFEDPFPEWARLLEQRHRLGRDGDELAATARRIVLAKRAFNVREGWTRADDALPDRFLDESLEVGSGRSADPHARAARRHDRGVLRGPGIAALGPAQSRPDRGSPSQGG